MHIMILRHLRKRQEFFFFSLEVKKEHKVINIYKGLVSHK